MRPTAVDFKHSRDLFRLKGMGRKTGKEGGGRKEVERKSRELERGHSDGQYGGEIMGKLP